MERPTSPSSPPSPSLACLNHLSYRSPMPSGTRLRNRICHAIASGADSLGATNEEIKSQLDEIFASSEEDCGEGCESDSGKNDDNVTPLMVACDKCCSQALLYLRTQLTALRGGEDKLQSSTKEITTKYLIEAWGHPKEESSCGNSAAHHALAVGFCEGYDLLESILGCIEKESRDEQLHRCLSLISQANQNGDTPLMMVCVSGHVTMIKHVLQSCLNSVLSDNISESADRRVEKTWQSLKAIFSKRNKEECTALNLACGYGHANIVKFLISPQRVYICWDGSSIRLVEILSRDNNNNVETGENSTSTVCELQPLVDVSYSDIDFCKKTVENLAAGLKFMTQQNQVDRLKEFATQHKQAQECLTMLETEMERISTETAKELLLDNGRADKVESTAKSPQSNRAPNSKGTGKKKKKQRNNIRLSQTKQKITNGDTKLSTKSGDSLAIETKHQNNWASKQDEPETDLYNTGSPFITLQDGSIVSKSQKADYTPTLQTDVAPLSDVISDTKQKTLQSILQSTSTSSTTDDDIASIMESLCLDPTMLLLSPHGMAMEMSPCQLDAIESILSHQLKATKEAQKIQRRLLHK